MAFRTLGELRADLIRRLGFGASGASAGVITANIDNFLLLAHKHVYEAHDWMRLRKYEDQTIGVDQYLLDYPSDANEERITDIWVQVNGVWREVHAGISKEDYTYQDNTSWPARYELYEQIELLPKADQQYTVRIWYIQQLTRLTQDGDRCMVDDELVFLHALANAKAHYRHADAQLYQGQFESLMTKLKGRSWTKKTFNRGGGDDSIPLVKPKVV
jgi:hypothetical protein